MVGLGDRMKHIPKQLSGGHEQASPSPAHSSRPKLFVGRRTTGKTSTPMPHVDHGNPPFISRDAGKTVIMVTPRPQGGSFGTAASTSRRENCVAN
jgi:predicted ABC-type transport system involved in lysophospholipase L1 biosynthesis ATPase subunit